MGCFKLYQLQRPHLLQKKVEQLLIVSQHGDGKGGAPDDICQLEKCIKAMTFVPQPRTHSSSLIDMPSFLGWDWFWSPESEYH